MFHHPLIRTVAYESQLKSDRAELHRRVAAAIESRDPAAADENAALIAEHLEAAGDLHAAYGWHMRAGAWATSRNMAAARASWERARTIADTLPTDDPDRAAMRIAPRTMLCGTAYRVRANDAGAGFDELRQLCARYRGQGATGHRHGGAGDGSRVSGPDSSGVDAGIGGHGRHRVAWRSDFDGGAVLPGDLRQVRCGEWPDVLRWSQGSSTWPTVIRSRATSSSALPWHWPWRSRGTARYPWDVPDGARICVTASTWPAALTPDLRWVAALGYFRGISSGALAADDRALREIDDALANCRTSRQRYGAGIRQDGAGRCTGPSHTAQRNHGLTSWPRSAKWSRDMPQPRGSPVRRRPHREGKAPRGDLDGAIPLTRAVTDHLVREGRVLAWGIRRPVSWWRRCSSATETVTYRSQGRHRQVTAAPAEPSWVTRDIWLLRLRALLARATGTLSATRLSRSLPRDGDIAGLRGAHRVGRSNAITVVSPEARAAGLEIDHIRASPKLGVGNGASDMTDIADQR